MRRCSRVYLYNSLLSFWTCSCVTKYLFVHSANSKGFNYQKALNIDAINNETMSLDGSNSSWLAKQGTRKFVMLKKQRKQQKDWERKREIIGFENVRAYNHNFGDYIFYKSMIFWSIFLENLAAEKNKARNIDARKKAAEYYLETMLLQYNTLLFNCKKKKYMKLINYQLYSKFVLPLLIIIIYSCDIVIVYLASDGLFVTYIPTNK